MVSLVMRGIWKSSIGVLTVGCSDPALARRRGSVRAARALWCPDARFQKVLLGVQLDDELLLHGGRDLATLRLAQHLCGERVMVGLEPRRDLRGQLGGVADERLRGGAGLDGDDVAVTHLIAGDVHPAAVDRPMAVADQLAGLTARGREAQAHEDVVQARLQHLKEVLAGDAGLTGGLLVVMAELLLEHAVVAARLLLLTQLHAVLRLLLAPAAVVAGRVRATLDAALVREAALALEEELLTLAAALLALGSGIASHQTRLLLRGRQPLWACGVTSRTPVTSRPAACRERMAVSRPEPGPFTKTSTFCSPCSMPLRAAASAVTCAAKGVDLREPLKPAPPADSQAMTLPCVSVSETIVLLKDVLMWAWPTGMFFFGLRRPRARFGAAGITSCRLSSCRRPACASVPCACGRWSSSSGREQAGRGGGAGRGSSRCPAAV